MKGEPLLALHLRWPTCRRPLLSLAFQKPLQSRRGCDTLQRRRSRLRCSRHCLQEASWLTQTSTAFWLAARPRSQSAWPSEGSQLKDSATCRCTTPRKTRHAARAFQNDAFNVTSAVSHGVSMGASMGCVAKGTESLKRRIELIREPCHVHAGIGMRVPKSTTHPTPQGVAHDPQHDQDANVVTPPTPPRCLWNLIDTRPKSKGRPQNLCPRR